MELDERLFKRIPAEGTLRRAGKGGRSQQAWLTADEYATLRRVAPIAQLRPSEFVVIAIGEKIARMKAEIETEGEGK